jgi:hypothetical protein
MSKFNFSCTAFAALANGANCKQCPSDTLVKQNMCVVALHSEEARSLFNRYMELLQSVSFILGLILAF